jgi:hypothetical protein
MANKELTPEEWKAHYKPIINTVNEGSNYVDKDGNKIYGWFDVWDEKDAEYLRNLDKNYVWTMINEDNHDYLVSGVWNVNRMEYYVCSVPWTGEEGNIVIDFGCCCDSELPECCEDCCKKEHDHIRDYEWVWTDEGAKEHMKCCPELRELATTYKNIKED